MSIQKMKLVSIVGPVGDFDRVISEYLLKFDIHVENSLSLLDNVKGLYPFSDDNIYNEKIARIEEFFQLVGMEVPQEYCDPPLCTNEEELFKTIDEISDALANNKHDLEMIKKRLDENAKILTQLEHIRSLDIDLDDLFKFSFIKFRIGRLPKEGYKKLKSYLQHIDAFFLEGDMSQDYIYGIYFMPAEFEARIDGVFSSLYFERIIVSGESHGTPSYAYDRFLEERMKLKEQESALRNKTQALITEKFDILASIYNELLLLSRAANIKKFSAHTRESFYITGWVSKRDVPAIQDILEAEDKIILVVEEPNDIKKITPPIKLKNPKIFKPFEMFVEMYGLPSYNEMDPTPLLAITYVLMFGIMFGDVGQGFLLFLGGLLIYRFKKMDLAAIISLAGFCSIIFGFVYGSIFGNEEILREYLPSLVVISPMHDITTILISTVGLGVVIIVISMLMNILNAIKNKQWGRLFFDQNGLSGMAFYITVLMIGIAVFLSADAKISMIVTSVFIGVPLLLIFFKEPLTHLLEKRKNWMPKNKGEFFLESFFELFEIILSYATNTISFVRLGAFALGHASMMSVVFILAEMTSGVGSIMVIIIGNIFVIALEGLVVGIQALRLEFYEMFSRYFDGEGRAFKSIVSKKGG